MPVRELAADPVDHQLDNVSVQSLEIECEAQVVSAALEGGGERYGTYKLISNLSTYSST